MIRKVLLLLIVAASAVAARAQLAGYVTATVIGFGGQQSSPVRNPNVVYLPNVDPIGETVGLFYDFKTIGPARLGIDLRGNRFTDSRGAQELANGAGTRLYSVLGGVRATFPPPPLLHAVKPYVQGSAGLGRSDYGLLTGANGQPSLVNNFEYHVYAGLEVRLFPALDLRAIELGYGGLDPFGANSHNYPLRSAAIGLVVHLGGGR